MPPPPARQDGVDAVRPAGRRRKGAGRADPRLRQAITPPVPAITVMSGHSAVRSLRMIPVSSGTGCLPWMNQGGTCGAGWGCEAGLRLACPLRSVRRNTVFPDGFDARQVGELPQRPRLPAPGRRVAAPAQAGAAGFTNVRTVAGPLPTGLRPPATARRGFHRKPR